MTSASIAILFATACLGAIMSVHIFCLPGRRFKQANACLAGAFALISLSAALLGIHLLHDLGGFIVVRALLALAGIPLLYLFFDRIRTESLTWNSHHGIHGVPLLAGLAVLLLNAQWLLDVVMMLTMIAYTIGLLRLWVGRKSVFEHLGDTGQNMTLWLQVVLVFLITTAVFDVAIFLDVADGGDLRQSSSLLFAVLSLGLFLVFAMIGALGRPSLFESLYDTALDVNSARKSPHKPSTGADHELNAIAQTTHQALTDPAILADDALTLTRLARRLGIPPRQVSRAINGVFEKGFSELLNDERITLCKTIMAREPEKPLTDVMMEAGYLSKSNFYKQFVKRAGVTPGAYQASLKNQS